MAEKLNVVFKMNCGIHVCTSELMDELEKIGYNYGGYLSPEDNCIITNHYHSEYHTFDNTFSEHDFYDCGTDIDLFLALVALRDDIDSYQLFKLPDGSVEKCECQSYIDMWGDWENGNYPVKMNMADIIIHFEPKILVIYVNSAEDTKDLALAYKDLRVNLLYNPTLSQVRKELKVTPPNTTVIMLGHGSPTGLFNENWQGYSVDSSVVNLLRDKKCVGIWCYASEFAMKYDLKGFFTSMFISNKFEAACHGFKAEDEEIYEQTHRFLKTINELIKYHIPMDEWIEVLDSTADLTIPYVKFNYEALSYLD